MFVRTDYRPIFALQIVETIKANLIEFRREFSTVSSYSADPGTRSGAIRLAKPEGLPKYKSIVEHERLGQHRRSE
jgi:hypothetical protein